MRPEEIAEQIVENVVLRDTWGGEKLSYHPDRPSWLRVAIAQAILAERQRADATASAAALMHHKATEYDAMLSGLRAERDRLREAKRELVDALNQIPNTRIKGRHGTTYELLAALDRESAPDAQPPGALLGAEQTVTEAGKP